MLSTNVHATDFVLFRINQEELFVTLSGVEANHGHLQLDIHATAFLTIWSMASYR